MITRPRLSSIFPDRIAALAADGLMCASMNFIQTRHKLHGNSLSELKDYLAGCEQLSPQEYFAVQPAAEIGIRISETHSGAITWNSPLKTDFSENNVAHADLFPCAKGWSAPTVLMLHALMSASDAGYRRWAARYNELGWNACFVHLPYHYSRTPRRYWNGELAITANLIRSAEGLRQGVMELRQLMAALRGRGCPGFGVLATSYGGWIGALLALVEQDFRFVALMAPIVNADHAIWKSPISYGMRRELRRAKIESAMVARHFHLSSPMHHQPLCGADHVLFAAGEFDLIARSRDIRQLQEKWQGSELLPVRQGHFGYRMMRETFARLKERGSI